MAPHLSASELDKIHQLTADGLTPVQVHKTLSAARRRARQPPANLTTIRRAIAVRTHQAGAPERRGRKRLFSRVRVKSLNTVRKALIKKAQGEREVHWRDILRSGRVRRGHPTTISRAFKREGIPVEWRRPREKPQRTAQHEQERVDVAREWMARPKSYFSSKIDLIIDNKKFDVPTHARGRQRLKQRRVRGHLRTPGEGLSAGFTRPNDKRHRMNVGAGVTVCAGICNGRIVLWEYLARRWNGAEAAALYRGPIHKALVKHRGQKRSYKVLEDNDPTGYKSKKAVAAKVDLGIKAIVFPRYSPDLNPLDFSLWDQIQAKMAQKGPRRVETVTEYRARLRRTALRMPQAVVEKAVQAIKARAAAVVAAGGKDIARD